MAQWIGPVAIIRCESARDETSEAALADAFKKRGAELQVTRLYRHDDVAQDRCWLRASGWCLAYE